ncbi:MAG: periplasmic heavy metal sensor [Prolixibacteraceae bacterium]|nr:periplasmic heavy metal sensor [Prolixibacteraceae bacterium]
MIVILVATNLSMGISFVYHKQQDKHFMEQLEETAIKVPSEQRTRFFREQLGLRFDQMDTFRVLNRKFNQTAWQITHQLENLRADMVRELGKENPNSKTLDSISKHIGELHSQLKKETIDYYLKMKAECNPEQQKKLNEIFVSMLKKNEDVKLPKYGRRNRIQNN